MARSPGVLLVLSLACFWLCVSGYPSDWNSKGNGCTSHPSQEQKNHDAPSPDGQITFALSRGGSTVTEYCPGATHTLQVTFPDRRAYLLTTTVGTLGSGTCPNRKSSNTDTTSVSAQWAVACGATSTATVKVTSATGSNGAFRTQELSVPISSACGACTPSSDPTPTPTPKPTPTPDDEGEEEEEEEEEGEDSGGDDNGSPAPAGQDAGGCDASSLGYDCSKQMATGVTLHWTTGTARPPANACTGASAAAGADPTRMLHMAIETTDGSGYSSLAFTGRAGSMDPSDAVVGYMNDDGTPNVATYYISGKDLTPSDETSTQWATNMGVVQSAGKTVVCFSRTTAVGAPASSVAGARRLAGARSSSEDAAAAGRALLQTGTVVSSGLDLTQDMNLIWAVGPKSGGFVDIHSRKGGYTVNVATGVSSGGGGGTDRRTWATTHGILMSVAFGLLMPAVVLVARHRTLLRGASCGSQQAWLLTHLLGQLVSLALLVAGIAIAFVHLDDNPLLEEGPGAAHRIMGIIVLALTGLQVLMGLVRPKPDHRLRPLFNLVHINGGRLTVLMSWAVLFLGVWLYDDLYGPSLSDRDARFNAWIACLAASMGLLVVVDLALTLHRHWSERRGGGAGGDARQSQVAPDGGAAASQVAYKDPKQEPAPGMLMA